MSDLAPLRTAKQALDEGLITTNDFDCVKVAFLKAQQIKTGVDAGFIRQDDYHKARDAFLHALDFQVMSTFPTTSQTVAVQPAAEPPNAASQQQQQQYPTAVPPRLSVGANSLARNSSETGSRSESVSAKGQINNEFGGFGGLPSFPQPGARGDSAPGSASNTPKASGEATGSGMLEIPGDIPKYAKGVTANKVLQLLAVQ